MTARITAMRPAGSERWERAVELGAQGRVAAARTLLDDVVADRRTSTAIVSLAHSTRASLTRQAGGHALARAADGRACASAAAADREPAAAEEAMRPWVVAAWVDGLVGLAADGLGIGDLAGSRILLDRAGDRLDERFPGGPAAGPVPGGEPWCTVGRVRLRVAWVRSEWGLYSGRLDVARSAAARAQALAAASPSARHRIKTRLIAAAVSAAEGDTPGARHDASEVWREAGERGLLPLQWAAASLLAGVTPGGGDHLAEVARLRAVLARRGMPIAPLAVGERHGR
ncbi:MAG: hypothetical protein QM809_18125 [Gordonia sp. (in: high G+C Gram-positive bacteria)]|uniref:hypothetical protein n=1 Tax=Gordonia sp. (in: high G+C Gram-positive bacteria) TaxID=84139 RepID=UPI0039E31896